MMDRLISKNRRARYDYEILESFEAGIVLTGTEIKSIREVESRGILVGISINCLKP